MVDDYIDLLLRRLDRVRKTTYGWQARCPAHDDRRPSLSVRVLDGVVVLHCFAGCSRREILGALGIGDARPPRVRAAPSPSQVGRAEREALYRYATECWEYLRGGPGRGLALGYLERRLGVDAELASELGLGYDPGGRIERPACLAALGEEPWLVVPFVVRGVLRGIQARRLLGGREPRWVSPAGVGWGKVGCFALERPGPVVLCEGPSDALACAGAGLASCFVRGAALASSLSAAGRVLAPLVHELRSRRVVVAGDGDEAGRRFARSCRASLERAGVDACILDPGDGLDLAYVRERAGAAELLRLVEVCGKGRRRRSEALGARGRLRR